MLRASLPDLLCQRSELHAESCFARCAPPWHPLPCCPRNTPPTHPQSLPVALASDDAIWSNFTQYNHTLLLGSQLLQSAADGSEAGCARRCSALANCSYWAFCPTDVTFG